MMLEPIFQVMISLTIIVIFIRAIVRITETSETDAKKIVQGVLDIMYPTLMELSLIFNCKLYCIGLVYEREHRVRHLLNFQGINSAAYVIGMSLADWIIFCVASILIILFGIIMELQIISNYAYVTLFVLTAFAFAFVMLINLLTSFETTLLHAFKNLTLYLWSYFVIGLILPFFFGNYGPSTVKFVYECFTFNTFFEA